uniref:ARF interacting protein 2 n=1 Tax=Anolis carolinensis TaxID=28377 RepID=H9GG58_ANOCA
MPSSSLSTCPLRHHNPLPPLCPPAPLPPPLPGAPTHPSPSRRALSTPLPTRTTHLPQPISRHPDVQPGRPLRSLQPAPPAPPSAPHDGGGGGREGGGRGEVRLRQEVGHQHLQVHEAAAVGALWPGVSDGGPGAGDADRAAARHQAQVRVRPGPGAGPDQPLLQPGPDPARPGRRLLRPQPEVPGAPGGVWLQRGDPEAALQNGETLLGAVNFFVSSINTLVNKTMEDTLMTVKQYETARLEYDAYRTDLEEANLGPRDAGTFCRLEAAQANFHAHRAKYEKLRADVAVKLKFLEENKVKVMHKQLLLFHNAISAYFAGNQTQLEQTLKQFNIRLKSPGAEKPSWLEEQ